MTWSPVPDQGSQSLPRWGFARLPHALRPAISLLIVARFVCFVAGTQWLYTIGDTLVPIVIILVTLILSGIMAYYWDKHEYKYTLDRFERRFMR